MTQHDGVLAKVKKMISDTVVLGFYDVNKEVTRECDSSGVGLVAVLTQEGKPVAYASRALTATYATMLNLKRNA